MLTSEERREFLQGWYDKFGAEKLIEHVVEYQMFMSARCNAHRVTIAQLTDQLAVQASSAEVLTADLL